MASIDLAGDGERRFVPYRSGLARAIAFEASAALVARCEDEAVEGMIRRQHIRNGALLMGLQYNNRN